MAYIEVGVKNPTLELIHNQEYYPAVQSLFRNAQELILASLFIVDDSPKLQFPNLVDQLLQSIRDAVWRGINVKLIIGGSRNNEIISKVCITAVLRARQLGIPCRLLSKTDPNSSHKKVVIVDDYILLGSHNWSLGAFTDQVQDSILVKSKALAAYLCQFLSDDWNRAG